MELLPKNTCNLPTCNAKLPVTKLLRCYFGVHKFIAKFGMLYMVNSFMSSIPLLVSYIFIMKSSTVVMKFAHWYCEISYRRFEIAYDCREVVYLLLWNCLQLYWRYRRACDIYRLYCVPHLMSLGSHALPSEIDAMSVGHQRPHPHQSCQAWHHGPLPPTRPTWYIQSIDVMKLHTAVLQ
jgi:hypothetical protein